MLKTTRRVFDQHADQEYTAMTFFPKQALACAALAFLCLSPSVSTGEPETPTYGHLAAGSGEQQDKDSYVLTLKTAQGSVDRILQTTQSAMSRTVLQDPDRSSELEEFRKFLLDKPFNEAGYGLAVANGEDANKEEITQIFLMLRHLGNDFYPHMFRVVNMVKFGEYPKRVHSMLLAFDFIEKNETMVEKFQKFDKAWYDFRKYVLQMEKDITTDVTGTEMLMISKLDEFARSDMHLMPAYDRTVRVLDNHLNSIRDDVLSKLDDDAATLDRYRETAQEALAKTKADFAKRYSFYPKVAPIIDNFETLLAQIEELRDVVLLCYKEAHSDGKVVGRIRMMKDLDPFGALNVEKSSVKNGCPQYHARMQAALDNAKDRYMRAAKRINELYKGKTGYKPIVWQ